MVQKEHRRRGRPRSFDESAVLDRARSVFWNLGYAASSLDDLATATGLNRPSLYGAFGDKHALYMASLEHSRMETKAALERALALPGSLREVLTKLFDAASRIYRDGEVGQRGCFLIGTAVTQAVDDAAARNALSAAIAECDAAFAERFEMARAAGELALYIDPVGAGAVASGTLHTLSIRARTGASESELKTVARAAIDLLCCPVESGPVWPI